MLEFCLWCFALLFGVGDFDVGGFAFASGRYPDTTHICNLLICGCRVGKPRRVEALA